MRRVPPDACIVIPAKAGIQGHRTEPVALDPGFRRGDNDEARGKTRAVASKVA
jgi:hypothetical protein